MACEEVECKTLEEWGVGMGSEEEIVLQILFFIFIYLLKVCILTSINVDKLDN